MRKDINDFKSYVEDIEKKTNELNSEEYRSNPKVSKQIEDVVNKVTEFLENEKPDIEKMIAIIVEQTRSFNVNMEDEKLNGEDKSDQPNLILQSLEQNDDILKERRKELNQIHITSSQLKSMTDKMAKDLDQQGAILDDIEANVNQTKENTEKAKKEITEAEKISTGNRKKFWCLLCIIFFAVGGVTAILLSLIL